jgi:hypothetical protein
VLVLAILSSTHTVAAERKVSPFFNRHEDGIAMEAEAKDAHTHKFRDLKQSATRRRQQRFLSVGSHPNLPNGGSNTNAGGGGASGVGSGNVVNDLPSDSDSSSSSSGSATGGGKGFLGKGGNGKAGVGGKAGANGKGNGLPKKSSKKSGKGGKGKGGSSSSSGKGNGGPGEDDDLDFSPVDPPQPCMCTPDFCDCEGGVATDYEFVLVRVM